MKGSYPRGPFACGRALIFSGQRGEGPLPSNCNARLLHLADIDLEAENVRFRRGKRTSEKHGRMSAFDRKQTSLAQGKIVARLRFVVAQEVPARNDLEQKLPGCVKASLDN
jgi:hypothetical protein